MKLFIAIDLGTTGIRSIVFNEEYEIVSEAYEEYEIVYGERGYVEQDAELWLEVSVRTVKNACKSLNFSDVAGISISSQGITVVPTDEHFRALAPAMSWLDVRATDEIADINAKYSQKEIFDITGKRLSPSYTLPKLIWMQKNMNDIFESARWFLLPHDFLIARLTGKAVTDHTLAAGTMMYNLKKADWSDELLGSFGISKEKLPQIMWSGSAVGKLRPETAEMLGLNKDVVVSIGAQDQKCAAYAVGISESTASISMGTSAAIEIVGTPKSDRIPCFNYVAPNIKVLEGVITTAGMSLRWLRDIVFDGLSYKELDDLAKTAEGKHDIIFFPFLSGEGSPGWNTQILAQFANVSLNNTKADIISSVLEGVAFELKRNVLEVDVDTLKELRIFGGGAKSDVWCQIIANALGRQVQAMNSHEMAALGAAMFAAEGTGFRNKAEVTPAKTGRLYIPEDDLRAYYDDKFDKYMQMYYKLTN